MVEYLDKRGLSYLWGKVKAYITSTLPTIITNTEMDAVLEEEIEEEIIEETSNSN